ncbi:monothiol glutaredoxin [Pycnococcus provasolii]
MAGALRRAVPSALASRLLVSSVYVTNTSGVHVRALSLSHGALSGLLLGRSGTDSSSTVFGVNARGFASSSSSDTHDDFKPQANEGTTASVLETIEKDLKANKVFVYMKGYPDFPQCGFSGNVCRVLDAYEVKYGSRNVLEDPELREGIKEYTKWPTIPQIFVDGEFVGGHDVLMQMHHDGTLEEEFHAGGKSTT